jgi:hypothetical protein
MKVFIVFNQNAGLITKTFAYKNEAIDYMDKKNEEYTTRFLRVYNIDICPEDPYTIVEQDVC